MVNNYCSVSGCSKESYPGCCVTFHKLPKDIETLKKWIEVIPGNLTVNSAICSLHFNRDDYVTEARKRLKPGTVPSLFPQVPLQNHATFV
nr:THAP domain-containing protein 6-like [Maniola hyperantus]